MIGGHTPGPWFPHGFTYPDGVVGDVFAKDSDNVLACTPICRVVEPVSKMDSDLRRPPIDALRAIARKDAARPIIEANARLIAAAPDLLDALVWAVDHFDGNTICNAEQEQNCIEACRTAIAKARGEA